VDPGSETQRRYLVRVYNALEKVRKVLREFDRRRNGSEITPAQHADGGTPLVAPRDNLVRAHEAARLLGIRVQDVYTAVHKGWLPAERIGRFLWLRRSDVEMLATQWRRGDGVSAPDSRHILPEAPRSTGAGGSRRRR
jgi:excisionase family DNA binding protein